MAEKIRIIKKYQNRKLYDTQDSCYVTLDNIAKMIRDNEEVSVIDNTTKADVTALILTQVLYEQEKNRKSVLPISVLRSIIQSASDSVYDFMSRYMVGTAEWRSRARDEAARQVENLVKRGDLTSAEADSLLKSFSLLLDAGPDSGSQKPDEKFLSVLSKLGDAEKYQSEIAVLQERIAALEARLGNQKSGSSRTDGPSKEASLA